MRTRRIAALSIALLLVSSRAWGHEFWLEPDLWRGASGAPVAIAARVGTAFRGELRPLQPERVARLLVDAAERWDLARAGRPGDRALTSFTLPDPGGALMSYESRFAAIDMEGADFDRYLADEGLDGARAARATSTRGAVRERYARCAKTWIAGSDPARARRAAGLTYELVPLGDPASGPFAVRALFRGRPLAGVLVRAWRRPFRGALDASRRDSVAVARQVRAGADGVARLGDLEAGEWLVASVHMLPGSAPISDWDSWWASFTFARGVPPAP